MDASRIIRVPLVLAATLSLWVFTMACDKSDSLSQEEGSSDSIARKTTDRQNQSEHTDDNPKTLFKLDACQALVDIEASLDTISAKAAGVQLCCDDDCVLAYLDSLTEKSIRTGNPRYVDALATVYTNADGYIAEYYESIWMKMMSKSPDRSLHYLCTRNWEGKHNLRTALQYAVAASVVGAKDSAASIEKIRGAFARYQAAHNVDSLRKCSENLWSDILAEVNRQSYD